MYKSPKSEQWKDIICQSWDESGTFISMTYNTLCIILADIVIHTLPHVLLAPGTSYGYNMGEMASNVVCVLRFHQYLAIYKSNEINMLPHS